MSNKILISIIASILALNGSQLESQTLFEWPSSRINIAGYSYLDNCIALGPRVNDSIIARDQNITDTIANPRAMVGLFTAAVLPKTVKSMTECLAQYQPDDIPRAYTLLAQKAFLDANRFDDADAVVRRGLSFLSGDTAAVVHLIDSAVLQYVKAIPFQVKATTTYMNKLESFGSNYRDLFKLRSYLWISLAAYQAAEDSVAFHTARRVLELAPSAIKDASFEESAAVSIGVGLSLRLLKGDQLIDSLRKSTSGYVNMLQANLKEVLGFIPPAMDFGKDAPILQGNFWYPSSAASGEYPAKGKISMVVFIPSTPALIGSVTDLTRLTVIRRLSERHPDVELIFSSSTSGHFGPLEPPNSDREAALLDSLMRTFHGIKNVLTVTNGEYIQLEEPDSRRVYLNYHNNDIYPPAGDPASKAWKIYLIDEDRKIVDQIDPNLEGEAWASRLIDALLTRKKSVPAGER